MRPMLVETYRSEGFSEVSTTYTQKPKDFVLLGNTADGAFTITLCPAVEAVPYKPYTIRKIGGGTNALTIALGSGDLGDLDLDTVAITTMEDDHDRSMFISDGFAWFHVASHRAD